MGTGIKRFEEVRANKTIVLGKKKWLVTVVTLHIVAPVRVHLNGGEESGEQSRRESREREREGE